MFVIMQALTNDNQGNNNDLIGPILYMLWSVIVGAIGRTEEMRETGKREKELRIDMLIR